MSSTKRIVLWTLGGLTILVLVLAIAARQWWQEHQAALRQELARGRAAGNALTASRCVDTVLTRHATAPGLAQTFSQSVFLSGCLDTARELPGLCQQSRSLGVIGSVQWTQQLCQTRGLSDQYCGTVLQPLLTSCRRLQESRRGG